MGAYLDKLVINVIVYHFLLVHLVLVITFHNLKGMQLWLCENRLNFSFDNSCRSLCCLCTLFSTLLSFCLRLHEVEFLLHYPSIESNALWPTRSKVTKIVGLIHNYWALVIIVYYRKSPDILIACMAQLSHLLML